MGRMLGEHASGWDEGGVVADVTGSSCASTLPAWPKFIEDHKKVASEEFRRDVLSNAAGDGGRFKTTDISTAEKTGR